MSSYIELGYETGLRNMESLANFYTDNVSKRNEATTRLHLIDTLLFDCLGWEKQDAYLEEPHTEGFADYVFFAPRRIMILEAKKEGDYFEIPAGTTGIVHSIKSLCRKNRPLKNALDQVASYCQNRGVPIGVFCNGHQIVAFMASRGDGSPPMDGKCAVFPSLHFMLDNFLDFWNLLSKPGIEKKTLQSRLLGTERPELPASLSATLDYYPGTKGRNPLQADLQIITELIIEDIPSSKELEDRFLQECYCQSGAISQHSLANKAILTARYAALFDEKRPGPIAMPATTKHGITPDIAAEVLSQRPILLIGDVGVGKTTFIKHLMKIDANEIFENAITIYINLGSQATLTSDLKAFILDEIVKQLLQNYSIDVEESGFVKSVYRSELTRFQKGIYGSLQETNPDRYREKQIELLENKLRNVSEHLKASLNHISKARKRQIIVFLDNADQRPDTIQDAAFLIAQEMAQHWPTLVYVPLRPETFQRSVHSGALSGYHPKAFTISPPRTDRVITKRLQFALDLIEENVIGPLLQNHPGNELKLSYLKKIILSFLTSLERNDDLIRCIDNISGGNMRTALNMVKGFFSSGHVDTLKIIRKTSDEEPYIVSVHEFVRATIFGDAIYYDPKQTPIANLFDISTNDPKEHFLLPLLLGNLRQYSNQEVNHGFIDTDQLYANLQGLGFTPDQIDSALVRAFHKNLVETPANQIPNLKAGIPRLFRITTIGLYHIERLAPMFTYVDAMIVVTPILDKILREKICDVSDISERLGRCEVFCDYLEEQWDAAHEASSLWASTFSWEKCSQKIRREIDCVFEKLN